MPALVLSAGLGTRLRPLTESLPKALVPIGDRPALAHVLARVSQHVAGPLVVNTHHEARAIEAFAETSAIPFRLSHEPDLLGTAGAISHAAAALGPGELVVWNGDIWTDLSVGLLGPLAAGTSAALVVERAAGTEGNVGVAADGSIVRLRRVTARADIAEAWSAYFLGIHRLDDAMRARAPSGVPACAIADLYLPAIAAGLRLEARVTTAPWIDVGSPRSYLAANLAWLGARPSYVGPGAIVSPNVEMTSAIIGSAAEVAGSGALDHVVVWPGANVVAPLANAIVMRDRVVQL